MAGFDMASWAQRRRSVDDAYNRNSATMAYSRFLSQQRGDRNLGDYQRKFAEYQPKFQASYGRRGLTGAYSRSGVYGQGMNRMASDYQRNLADMYDSQAQENAGYDLRQADLDAQRQFAINQLEAEKQSQIAQAAALLQAFRAYGG